MRGREIFSVGGSIFLGGGRVFFLRGELKNFKPSLGNLFFSSDPLQNFEFGRDPLTLCLGCEVAGVSVVSLEFKFFSQPSMGILFFL